MIYHKQNDISSDAICNYLKASTICNEVELMSDNRVDVCLFIKCQPCFDDEQTFSLLIPALTHVATC